MEGEAQLNGTSPGADDGTDGVRTTRPSLLALMIEAGVAPEEELRSAATAGMATGERLGDVAVRNGWLDEQGLSALVARQWSLPFVADDQAVADHTHDDRLSPDMADTLGACLIAGESAGPRAAVAEPSTGLLDSLRRYLGPDASFAVVTGTTLTRLLRGRPRPQPTVEEGDLDTLVESLTLATGKLSGLRERIAELTVAKETAEARLTEAGTRVDELERMLAEERERTSSFRRKLAALVDELGRG